MADSFEALRPAILLGVGAAFDFHSEIVSRAPSALRSLGLEWLYRLAGQPRRLWRRYLLTNTLFIAYLARDALFRGRRGQKRAWKPLSPGLPAARRSRTIAVLALCQRYASERWRTDRGTVRYVP